MKLILSILAAAITAAAPALAQGDASASTWPQRQVRVIVPFPAGSATDVVVRILESAMSQRLGQPLVVDNRSGASGSLGVDAVAKADPDGYTMGLITASTHAVAPGLGRRLPYDPIASFTPVGIIGSTPYVLAVYADLEAKDLAGLLALSKANPGKLNYGSAGPGSLAHLAAALLAVRSGIEIVHVPYRSTAHAVTDIVAGRVQMQFATIPPTMELIAGGKLRALAVSGAKRATHMPDIPTVAEALPGFEATLWMALVMPARTPEAVTDRANRVLNAALTDPRIRDALLVQGVEPEPGPSSALVPRISADLEKWRDVIQKAGIKAD